VNIPVRAAICPWFDDDAEGFLALAQSAANAQSGAPPGNDNDRRAPVRGRHGCMAASGWPDAG